MQKQEGQPSNWEICLWFLDFQTRMTEKGRYEIAYWAGQQSLKHFQKCDFREVRESHERSSGYRAS